jgi:hypothetical protein
MEGGSLEKLLGLWRRSWGLWEHMSELGTVRRASVVLWLCPSPTIHLSELWESRECFPKFCFLLYTVTSEEHCEGRKTKEKLTEHFLEFAQKIEEKETVPSLFYESIVILMSKPSNDIIKKRMMEPSTSGSHL